MAQILQDSMEYVDSSEIDIFQKFYYAVNDGRFNRAVDKVIDAHRIDKNRK